MGFTACNARLIDGQGRADRGCRLLVRQRTARSADRGQAFAPIDPSRVPRLDPAKRSADWLGQSPYRLYTKRLVHWVWVSTSSMMFRRSLIDLVFPGDDESFRLHMDFYIVIMAQMVSGSLLIDEPLYSIASTAAMAPPTIPCWAAGSISRRGTGVTRMPACSIACWRR